MSCSPLSEFLEEKPCSFRYETNKESICPKTDFDPLKLDLQILFNSSWKKICFSFLSKSSNKSTSLILYLIALFISVLNRLEKSPLFSVFPFLISKFPIKSKE